MNKSGIEVEKNSREREEKRRERKGKIKQRGRENYLQMKELYHHEQDPLLYEE